MYILQLTRIFIPTEAVTEDDGSIATSPIEAIFRSDNIQDLILLLDQEKTEPFIFKGEDVNAIRTVTRYFKMGTPLCDYRLPPPGDLLQNGTIINMTTLEQRIQEVCSEAEKATTANWNRLVENTLPANEYLTATEDNSHE